MSRRKRIFTLREAQELLPRVRALTAEAYARAEAIEQAAAALPSSHQRNALEAQFAALARGWAELVLDLGCEVKGLWLVDFDSGDGLYYCWQHPEEHLGFFHDYDAGFAGRKPLGPLSVG
jgi:hypothetical protein